MPFELPNPKEIFQYSIDFDRLAERIWQVQALANAPMAEFVKLMALEGMEFMPVSFFKDFEMRCGTDWNPDAVFFSSGTTGQARSKHHVRYLSVYQQSLLKGFHHHFPEGPYRVLGLMPSPEHALNSSLVWMVKTWMESFGLGGSGFFMHDFHGLKDALEDATIRGERILLIGLSYALLDFSERFPVGLPADTIVMETGGMKGQREELVRDDLHGRLKTAFKLDRIYSEYGMSEMLSQAYTDGGNRFRCPPWMKVVVTDLFLPGKRVGMGQTGRINIIDLANLHSCSFLRTDDLGRLHPDGSFEVLGRLDHAEMRGCNLMYWSD
jgi:hypothetical protein